MRITVTCRNCELEPELRTYIDDKVSHLAHYFDRVDEAHVVLQTEGHRCIADVTVHASRAVISSEQVADEMRSAFDRSIDKVERQIRKYKERVRHHKGVDATADVAMSSNGVSLDELGIVPERLGSEAMTPDEAFSELEELQVAFFVFTNAETSKVNVIYRRGDGDYGLVEPAK